MALEFPNIDPVAIELGPLVVRWYALAYLAGILIGWRYALSLAGVYGGRPNKDDLDDFVAWAIGGIILGGRLGYVLFYNLEYYLGAPLEALKVWQGGMSFHGGVLGVLVAMAVFARLRGFSFLRLADIVTAVAPIGLFFGRIANFINGELYGRVSDVPWAVRFPHGGDVPRHPSQLYEAILEGLVLATVLFILTRIPSLRVRPGFIGGAFLAGYGAFRAFVELFREPDAHIGFIFAHISMGQVLSVPMALAGVGVMVWAWQRGARAAD
jgi:phosphatidylglycerol:prolipoprotein diacylglycerol transferase